MRDSEQADVVLDCFGLMHCADQSAALAERAVHDRLVAERSAGKTVLGYGAASRAAALLRQAGVNRMLLPAVADASPAKQGMRMPGTEVPVVSPEQLAVQQPDAVLLFLADLLTEVRALSRSRGRWRPMGGRRDDPLIGA